MILLNKLDDELTRRKLNTRVRHQYYDYLKELGETFDFKYLEGQKSTSSPCTFIKTMLYLA